ncbi:glutathione S-transferase, C-terminal domain protein [Leptospira weilii serovar Ranarum str. ICFT]|uniref:Glutathione S-transferase, C-terminal domain protein n=1 Tax=Leptospira weilii serovar Ranarum str. ICFT TaxID=1218598 RepID=N1WPR9_9LEPT|nr:glutathione S-transferase, C-terminal domain protein [Leptospira weilii serovar Ranarum str. ICFT]
MNLLENHLAKNLWLADERPTIDDLAMYPYIALANEGKVDLETYNQIRNWLDRVEKLPGYVSMPGIVLQ